MGMMKNYLLDLLQLCSDEQFGQDAVEWAIVSGFIRLTYDQEQDLLFIMGEPGKPETGQYPIIVDAFQRIVQENNEALIESYRPLLEELNRSIPLAMQTPVKRAA
jgi:hypothetical protein